VAAEESPFTPLTWRKILPPSGASGGLNGKHHGGRGFARASHPIDYKGRDVMYEPADPLSGRQTALRWGLFLVTLVVWTALLVSPRGPGDLSVVPSEFHFWLAKTAHVLGYAALGFLFGCLPLRPRPRLVGLLLLVGHGGLTEFIQQFVPGRYPSLRDVGLDVLGLTLGMATLSAWRRLRRA
jgi:VanZ family protein